MEPWSSADGRRIEEDARLRRFDEDACWRRLDEDTCLRRVDEGLARCHYCVCITGWKGALVASGMLICIA